MNNSTIGLKCWKSWINCENVKWYCKLYVRCLRYARLAIVWFIGHMTRGLKIGNSSCGKLQGRHIEAAAWLWLLCWKEKQPQILVNKISRTEIYVWANFVCVGHVQRQIKYEIAHAWLENKCTLGQCTVHTAVMSKLGAKYKTFCHRTRTFNGATVQNRFPNLDHTCRLKNRFYI